MPAHCAVRVRRTLRRGAFPHLHFDISPCADNLGCDTPPVTFRNTTPNPNGLRENTFYEALPYDGS